MTEQELTQARADLALLDIEQLRCGVMLQLLKIDDLTKERDAWKQAHDEQVVKLIEIANERDAALEQNTELDARCAKLEAAAKLAVLQMGRNQYLVSNGAPSISAERFHAAIEALRQAGVQ